MLKVPIISALKSTGLHWSVVVAYTSVVLLVFCIYQFVWINNKIKKLLT